MCEVMSRVKALRGRAARLREWQPDGALARVDRAKGPGRITCFRPRRPALTMSNGERSSERDAAVNPECFIGITSWNSEGFLGHCIDQIYRTTRGRARVVLLDNVSTDRSAE